jgi:hypothetical protein
MSFKPAQWRQVLGCDGDTLEWWPVEVPLLVLRAQHRPVVPQPVSALLTIGGTGRLRETVAAVAEHGDVLTGAYTLGGAMAAASYLKALRTSTTSAPTP